MQGSEAEGDALNDPIMASIEVVPVALHGLSLNRGTGKDPRDLDQKGTRLSCSFCPAEWVNRECRANSAMPGLHAISVRPAAVADSVPNGWQRYRLGHGHGLSSQSVHLPGGDVDFHSGDINNLIGSICCLQNKANCGTSLTSIPEPTIVAHLHIKGLFRYKMITSMSPSDPTTLVCLSFCIVDQI